MYAAPSPDARGHGSNLRFMFGCLGVVPIHACHCPAKLPTQTAVEMAAEAMAEAAARGGTYGHDVD